MMDFLVEIDQSIFAFIYAWVPHIPLFDAFFSFLSGVGSWGFVWVVILFLLYLSGGMRHKNKFFSLFVALFLSLLLSEFILKNIFARTRPEVFFSDTYSFPSSHAALAFAGAYVLGKGHRRLAVFYFIIALLIAFSRLYLGRHFFSDVVAGALLGLFIGFVSVKISGYETKRKRTTDI